VPASNPFAPLIDVGGGATIGPASGNLSGSVNVGDHHASAGLILAGLAVLILLHKSGHFRFSTQVG
jgi:hypothetical protein